MKLFRLYFLPFLSAFFLFPLTVKATIWKVTNTSNAGAGSLRAACDSVVNGDSVRFDPLLLANGSQAITLDSAIILNKSISVTGLYNLNDSLFISGGGSTSVFEFTNARRVILDSLLIKDGYRNNSSSNTILGGGISIVSVDSVYISHSRFTSNAATHSGGAVYYAPTGDTAYLELSQCEFRNNSAPSGGGFFASGDFVNVQFDEVDFFANHSSAYGAAIRVDATDSTLVSVASSTFKNHFSLSTTSNPIRGGAISIASNNSQLNVNRCEFENNQANSRGGAIYTWHGKINVVNSTFVNNSCVLSGGAIANMGNYLVQTNLLNSTFVSNKVTGLNNDGGAVYCLANNSNGTSSLDIKNCTFYKNEADDIGGVYNSSPLGGSFNVEGSIFCENVGGNVLGFLSSQGYNIFSDSARTDTVSSDQINIDSASLNLLSLANNGRFTRTLMPGPGSVALEAGNPLDSSDAQNAHVMGIREVGAAEVCYNTYDTSFIVACDNYTWINGITYFVSDTGAVYTIPNAAGCDSVVTLNLTLFHSTDTTITHTVCDSLVWLDGNTYFFSNNTAMYVIPNSVGCDSVIYLDLTVSNTVLDTQVACDSLIWRNGVTYYSDTTRVTDTVFSSSGCDTVYYLDLTILNSSIATDSISACGTYTWNGITYNQSNYSALDTLTNYLGCDSIVQLALTITPNIHTYDTVSGCYSYTWINGVTYLSSNNTATYTLPAANGCDSIIHLDLSIGYPVTGVDTQTVCDSLIWLDGNTYYSSTQTPIYTIAGGSSLGCDSIVSLHLTVLNSMTTIETVTACQSYTWNGITYTSSTNAPTDTLVNSFGCDSVVTLDLTILQPTHGIETIVVCDSFTWNGVFFTQNNYTATDTLVNAMGCDSIVTLDLTILNSTQSVDMVTACGSYTWIDGNTYYASTNAPVHVLQNGAGCDSIVQLNLTINSVDTAVIRQGLLLTAQANNASYQWLDCQTNTAIWGETQSDYTVSTNGEYAVQITQNGCVDTSNCISITNVGLVDVSLSNTIRVYPNPVQDQVNIEITNWPTSNAKIIVRDISGKQVYLAEIEPISNQETISVNTTKWAKGTYFIEVGEGPYKVVEQVVVQ